MFHFVHETSMQLLNRFRRMNKRCEQKYALIQEEEPYLNSSHTLSKMEKKRGFQTNTMKPMSAHDEKTLDTAVALANEITTRSMNDLDGDQRHDRSPTDRSKFHFRFPHLYLNHSQPHDAEKDPLGKHAERRNFSEEAKSVPDIQSTITEESKLAYASLIEEPTPSSSLIAQIADVKGMHKPATIPKPTPRALEPRAQFHSLHKPYKPARTPFSEGTDQNDTSSKNELPLPPRSTKPLLVDKPRHIRKHPLKLPSMMPEPNRPRIYQNALSCTLPLKNEPFTNDSTSPHKNEPYNKSDCTAASKNGVDVCDGVDTNPFSSSVNPFDCFIDDADCGLEYPDENDGSDANDEGGLIKDCSDHVSVEDLLEFADQKPCGRQRGVESDEVRIMSKVLQQQVTAEQCLQALELSDWNVHLAIKVIRVREAAHGDPSLGECASQLNGSHGDITKAAAILTNKYIQ